MRNKLLLWSPAPVIVRAWLFLHISQTVLSGLTSRWCTVVTGVVSCFSITVNNITIKSESSIRYSFTEGSIEIPSIGWLVAPGAVKEGISRL